MPSQVEDATVLFCGNILSVKFRAGQWIFGKNEVVLILGFIIRVINYTCFLANCIASLVSNRED